MKLRISDDLFLPLDTVTSTIVVYGGKGMGKTVFGSVLCEELSHCKLHWSFLDPLGVAWGLRHSSNGKGKGIECVLLGGTRGDIPIESTGGHVVADFVVDEPVNVIVDFSRKPSGEMWSVGEKVRFLTDYTKRLFQRQGGLTAGRRREPLFQILDEAARYIPQIIPHGAQQLAECVGAWETLVEEGRNIGIGVCLITQRSARMNKSVSEICDAMVAFRTIGPNSIAAVTDWLGTHIPKEVVKQHIETLRSLDRGRCLIVSPGWLKFEGIVSIRNRETFDSSATPKAGERQRGVGQGATPNLEKYVERMKETIERAKANDPKVLKARIRELEIQAKKQAVVPSASQPAKIDERAVERAIEKNNNEWRRRMEKVFMAYAPVLRGLAEISKRAAALASIPVPQIDIPKPSLLLAAPATVPRRFEEIQRTEADANGKLRAGAERMLAALAQWSPEGMAEGQMRAHAGMKRSGTFSTYMSDLRRGGYVEERDGLLFATESGLAYCKHVPSAPTTTAEVLAIWEPKLREGARRMLRELIAVNGKPVDKDDLALRSGMTKSGTFSTYLSDLKTARLITVTQHGIAANAETLFL